jgi:hypothetical protein
MGWQRVATTSVTREYYFIVYRLDIAIENDWIITGPCETSNIHHSNVYRCAEKFLVALLAVNFVSTF